MGLMWGDTEGPAEPGDEVREEELATVKAVAHFFPSEALIGDDWSAWHTDMAECCLWESSGG